VLFGADPDTLVFTADSAEETVEHIIKLEGLTPDTTYYYAVGDGSQIMSGGDAEHFFLTAPVVGTAKPTRIWVLGDSGTGTANARAVRDAYYELTEDVHTDLWLMLGDNAYPDGTDLDYQVKLFEFYPEMLRKSVLWPSLGNHDAVSANSSNESGVYYDAFTMPRAAEAGGWPSGTEAYYSFDYANIHFIVLDSMESDRSPASDMMTWLEIDAGDTDQQWIVAFWHHPPYSKGGHDSDTETRLIDMRQNALPILEDFGVDLVLTGHSHSYERSYLIDGVYGTPTPPFAELQQSGTILDDGDGREPPVGDGFYTKPEFGDDAHQGTVYTVAGSSGQITNNPPFGHPVMRVAHNVHGSVILDVDGARLDLRFLDLDGNVLDSFTMIKQGTCSDPDGDEVCSAVDNCPDDANGMQEDGDNDGLGDVCDPCPGDAGNDEDNDDVCALLDNCDDVFNPQQDDTDLDGHGNACDTDDDADTYDDLVDCAPLIPGVSVSPSQVGTLAIDKAGGATLRWLRGVQTHTTNVYRAQGQGPPAWSQFSCLAAELPGTTFTDAEVPPSGRTFFYLLEGRNACGDGSAGQDSVGVERLGWLSCPFLSQDTDGDVAVDVADNCPPTANSTQYDDDRDFVGDACDNCEFVHNVTQSDCDGNGIGNACDVGTDCDGDLLPGAFDTCPDVANPDQADDDLDAVGNACDDCPNDRDNDIDHDNHCANEDNCPEAANPMQADFDGDGVGDPCDPCPVDNPDDADGDGVCEEVDICFGQDSTGDSDGDGICDSDDLCFGDDATGDTDDDGTCDSDDPCPDDNPDDADGDLVCTSLDNCPEDANADQLDFDGDGAGDLCDEDDDNDGVDDVDDCAELTAGVSTAAESVGATLRLDRGPGGTELSWLRGYQGHTSNVYRAQLATLDGFDYDLDCLSPETPEPAAVDDVTPLPGTLQLYLVSARNSCGDSEIAVNGQGTPVPASNTCPAINADSDDDGNPDPADNCPLAQNPLQADGDGDFVGDDCDNCLGTPNPDQADDDGDGEGNACDLTP